MARTTEVVRDEESLDKWDGPRAVWWLYPFLFLLTNSAYVRVCICAKKREAMVFGDALL